MCVAWVNVCVRALIEKINQQTLIFVNVSALPPVGSSAEGRPIMQSKEKERVNQSWLRPLGSIWKILVKQSFSFGRYNYFSWKVPYECVTVLTYLSRKSGDVTVCDFRGPRSQTWSKNCCQFFFFFTTVDVLLFGFLHLCLGWLVSCLCTHRFLFSCSSYFTLPVFSVSCETEVFLWSSIPPHRKSEGSLFLYKLIEILKKKNVCTRGLHFCFTPSLSQSVAPSRPSQSLLFIQFDYGDFLFCTSDVYNVHDYLYRKSEAFFFFKSSQG